MAKFKRNDKVKLTTIEDIGVNAPHLKVGDVGTIISYLNFPTLFVVEFENVAPGIRNNFAFDAFELELVDHG